MAFSPDGSRLAVPGADGDTTVWDVDTQTEGLRLASGHPAGFFAEPQAGRGADPTPRRPFRKRIPLLVCAG